ncbi:MAG: hypothetical protein ABWY23_05790 [Mycetocola sp.]
MFSAPPLPRRRKRWAAIGSVLLLGAAGVGVGTTAAAWVDVVNTSATATASSFDIWGRFASDADWEDIGLPGDPDTYTFPIDAATYDDVLPAHSYLGDVFLCNAGDIDGVVTSAILTETDPEENPVDKLVLPGSIEVDEISIGTIIPANSCPASPVSGGVPSNPPDDIEGVIHFTTVDDFAAVYGNSTRIVIKIDVESVD